MIKHVKVNSAYKVPFNAHDQLILRLCKRQECVFYLTRELIVILSLAVLFRKCKLGVHWRRRGPSAEERRLAPLQDYDGVQVQSQAPDHRHTPPELTQRALVSTTFHYA